MMNKKYKPPEISTSDLKTPVTFFEYQPVNGPEPNEEEKTILHKCYALVYNPSMKDREILKTNETKQGLTIKIRDTKGEYLANNNHFVEIGDYRYPNKIWNVIDVSYGFEDNRFLKIVLGDPHDS